MRNYIAFRSLILIVAILLVGSLQILKSQPNTPWPEWVFHHWVWEDESTQASAIALVDDYLAHDIPVGAIIIDSPWETEYNTFDWDTTRYPDPQEMIDYFHSKNVRVLLWITTAMNFDTTSSQPVRDSLYAYAASQQYFMQKNANSGPAKLEWWKGWGSMVDLLNPDAVAWWKTLMDKVLDMGIDGWKCDGTDYSLLNKNNPLAPALYSPGLGTDTTLEAYSDAYYRLFHDYTRQRLGNDRVNMTRPVDNYGYSFLGAISFTPKDIGWACWVGDQDATFEGMKAALNNMYFSDDVGYLIFGSDIGGYRENDQYPVNKRSRELLIRWAQLGAFSPLMENGGSGEHRPWMFDEQTTEIYRTFTRLHYALIPYFMEQSLQLSNAGESMMQFFSDTNYAYMLGSDIFVTPVLTDTNVISIDFPAGNESWIYIFNKNQVYQGNTSVTLNIPLEEYPVFLKASSPLVYLLDSVLNATGLQELSNQNREIKIYPNPAKNEFKVSGLKFKVGEEYKLRLYNALGENILTSQLADEQMTVDVEGLKNGVYFYAVTSGDGATPIETGKLVIQ